MLHELLFALMGHTGDVFSVSASNNLTKVELDARVRPLVNVSEAALLERLASLGGEYAALIRFVEQNSWWGLDARGARNGAYLAALCAGLQQHVLDPYCAAVLELEQQALRAPASLVTLSGFAHALRVHSVVLPMVRVALRAGEVGGVRSPTGAPLLDMLHVASQQGDPLGKTCFEALQWHCHGVMYRYLGAWMIHGLLLDEFGEFFVDEAESFRAHARERAGSDARAATSTTPAPSNAGTEFLRDWHERFFVRLDALPSYVTVRTAEAALFVGKAVRVLDHRKTKGTALGGRDRGEWGSQEDELITASDRDDWERELRVVRDERPFRSANLELAVERIRGTVSDRLWQLVVERGRLMDHLAVAKDYFLLARGDFYQCLVEEVDPVMCVPPRPATVDLALDAAFAQAGARSTADENLLFRRLRMSIQRSGFSKERPPAQGEDSEPSGPAARAEATAGKKFVPDSVFLPRFDDGWDVLGLEYRVEWPAALVIGPGSLRRYNAMWRHLFRLRRAQHNLEHTWATGMAIWKDIERVKRRASFSGRPEAKVVFVQRIADMQASWTRNWRLRNRMAYLVTNLQFYIQVDVIETRYAELVRRVSAARDFESVVRAHESYVAALIGECFLDLSMVTGLFEKLLRLCDRLCATMHEAHSRFHEVLQEAEDEATEDESASSNKDGKAAQLEDDISRGMAALYSILQSDRLANSKRAPFLRQLLLRLNFNGFVGSAVARAAVKARPPASKESQGER